MEHSVLSDIGAVWDYIVVGAGSAGAVLGRRLAEDTDARVLVLESGPTDEHVREISDPAAWAGLATSRYDYRYVYAPARHAMGQSIPIPRGRVVGGCSSTNAMLWYRGHPSDYDAWEQAGATGWNFRSVLPYFRRAEDWEGGATALRGTGGPLRITRSPDPHPIARALLAAAAECGFPVLEDGNGPDNEGASLANLNIADGERWSTSRGYLRPAMAWPNLTLLTDVQVTSLVVENGACTGVRVASGSTTRVLSATREVVLAAGAIDTPRLLLLSGIGPAAELERLGLPVRVDLPGVGMNLQDHPLLKGMNFVARAPLGPIHDQGGGAMMNWKSDPALQAPDLHAFIVQRPHASPELRARYDIPDDSFAISPGLMGSKSRGYMRLLEARHDGAVEIQPEFLAEPSDLRALASAVETVFDLAESAAFRDLVLRPASPARRLDRAGREAFVRESLSTFFHVCGTCSMGTDEMSVVDPTLRVRGVDGLRIADASVIPVIPTCNTLAPVVMVAERAADMMKEGT
ncbi:FAD-binding protein [Komagataeibacter melaceti]|uniref:FAD-binding protein n=1 Tax=Komagataeibacter melaceti TaxID=2766577 RepID=A0A371Z4J2_9PROT|nr:GMC family oxidoreductase N-terminal domain-containing protein [Komagataeibacter melaceti]RFD21413.1 FAD-binding protein [Komagataeibacter melaceti]